MNNDIKLGYSLGKRDAMINLFTMIRTKNTHDILTQIAKEIIKNDPDYPNVHVLHFLNKGGGGKVSNEI